MWLSLDVCSSRWEDIASQFETELKEKKMGLFGLKAWTSRKEVWEGAKEFERLAMVRDYSSPLSSFWRRHQSTSATAIRDSLRCEQYHHVQTEGCYHCTERRYAPVPTCPDPTPQQEMITHFSVIHDTSHPAIHVNVQVGSYSTDDQPNGQTVINVCVSSLATMDHVPPHTLPVAPPETVDTS